jgi:hypothetical protein
MKIPQLLALGLILQGCRSTPNIPEWPEVPTQIRGAVEELLRNSKGQVEVETPRQMAENWSVIITSLPKTPGGFTIYEISPSGKIVKIYSGY